METYVASDSDVNRPGKKARLLRSLLVSAVTLLGPLLLGWALGEKYLPYEGAAAIGRILGLIGSVALSSRVLPSFWFWVSGNKFLLATDKDGNVIVFGPGLHAADFFDIPKKDGNISAEVRPIDFEETVACKDGVALVVKGQGLVQVDPEYITVFDNTDNKTIETGVAKELRTWVSDSFATKNSDTIRTNLEKQNRRIRKNFGEDEDEFRKRFGLHWAGLQMFSADYPKGVQDTLDARFQKTEILNQISHSLVGTQEVSNGRRGANKRMLSGHDLVVHLMGKGEITDEQYRFATRTVMVISDKAKLDFNVNDVNVKGLNPDLVAGVVKTLNAFGKGGEK
jgi:hypothetical protein